MEKNNDLNYLNIWRSQREENLHLVNNKYNKLFFQTNA